MATSYLKEYLLSQLCKLGIDWPPAKEEEKPVVVQQTITEAGYTPLLPTDEIPVALLPGMLRLDKQSWLNAMSIEATFSSDVEDGDLVYPVAAGVSGEFISNVAELRDAVWKPVNQVSGTASTDENSPRIWGIAYKHVGRVMFGPVVFHQRFAFKTGDILYVGDGGEITTSNEGAVLGICLAPGSIFIDLSVTSSKLALDALQDRVDKLEQDQEEASGSISDLTEEIKDIQNELNKKRENRDDISNSTVIASGSTTARPLKDRFADVVNVKDFGAKGDGVTDDTAALKAAMLHVSLLGGGELQVPEGVYIISDTLIVPDNVVLIGRGVGYEYYHPTTFLFKGTGIKRYSLSEMPVYSIENPDAGAPYLADSGNRGDTYKTLDLQDFSAAVILGKRSGIISIAIIPYFNGVSGYRDQSSGGLSDDWDVGIWCRNADSWYLSKTTSIGHWRKAALLITSSNIGDGKIPSCEQGHAEFCRFQGFRGVAIRSPEPESNSNYGFAGTDFINCLIKPLEHQGLCLATSSFISTPFDSPSASLEISGNVIRGIQFSMCTLIGRDDISIIAPKCREIRFYGCYQESKGINVNGVWVPLAGSRMVGGKATNMQFYGCSKYAIDFSPFYTRESSVTRYPSSTGVLLAGGVVRDEEYMFPEFGTTNGFRMIPGGVFRIYKSNFDEAFTITSSGEMVLTGTGVNTLRDNFAIKRSYGTETEDFIFRTYSTGNVEFFTGQFLVGGHFAPTPDGTSYCGMSARRWKEIFAVNGAISTSDAREKQMVSDIPESVFRAWSRVNFCQFLFNDAVEKKGGAARLHVGIVAQQVKKAFEADGLDVTRYGLLCYDKWEDEYEDVEVEDEPPVLDADGNEVTPAKTHTEKRLVTAAGDRYGIRYSEAFCLEAAYQRRRASRLESRVAALETALQNLNLPITLAEETPNE